LSLSDRNENRRSACFSAMQLGIKAALAGLVAVVAGARCIHESSGMAGAPMPVAGSWGNE
jgi:hypothetical protein